MAHAENKLGRAHAGDNPGVAVADGPRPGVKQPGDLDPGAALVGDPDHQSTLVGGQVGGQLGELRAGRGGLGVLSVSGPTDVSLVDFEIGF